MELLEADVLVVVVCDGKTCDGTSVDVTCAVGEGTTVVCLVVGGPGGLVVRVDTAALVLVCEGPGGVVVVCMVPDVYDVFSEVGTPGDQGVQVV